MIQFCFVVSDDLNHDKIAVWAMLKSILKLLKDENMIEHVIIVSDGCAAQFKNRYTLTNLCFMKEDFEVSGEWYFSASSHGKGSVDALGGTVKRSVWRQVKARKFIVINAETFFTVSSHLSNYNNLLCVEINNVAYIVHFFANISVYWRNSEAPCVQTC